MSLQTARYVVAAGIAAVVLAIIALVAVLVIRGGVTLNAEAITGLVSFVGILVGLLANLLGTGTNLKQTGEVQSALNGHLQAHQGTTEDMVRDLVDQELNRRGVR